jgi:hypothetical protein
VEVVVVRAEAEAAVVVVVVAAKEEEEEEAAVAIAADAVKAMRVAGHLLPGTLPAADAATTRPESEWHVGDLSWCVHDWRVEVRVIEGWIAS